MTEEFVKSKVFRKRKTERRSEDEKWKHNKAEPYVRKPLTKKELQEQLQEEDYD